MERQGVVCPVALASHGQITKQTPDSSALAAVLLSGNRAVLGRAAAYTGVCPESPGHGWNLFTVWFLLTDQECLSSWLGPFLESERGAASLCPSLHINPVCVCGRCGEQGERRGGLVLITSRCVILADHLTSLNLHVFVCEMGLIQTS